MFQVRPCRCRIFDPRASFSFVLGSIGVLLTVLSFSANSASESGETTSSINPVQMPSAAHVSARRRAHSTLLPDTTAGFTGNINALSGVACPSASDCWAAGFFANRSGVSQTLIEHWDGAAWSIVPSPDRSTMQINALTSIACASVSDCWAVGDFNGNGSQAETLTLHWNGASWSIVPSPNTGFSSTLDGVACISPSDCWAVGRFFVNSASTIQALIEHWNGAAWSIVSSPNVSGSLGNALAGVSCLSASDCWAVGFNNVNNGMPGGAPRTLIEHWDGSSWSVVSSPNPSATYDVLTGVTCPSASQCWAVGYTNNGNASQTLIELWNGNSWTAVNSPSPNPNDFLFSVTCVSSSDCWTVGDVIEHWNGNAWSVVPPAPYSGPYSTAPNSVACVSPSDCWAIGPLGQHWDGMSWSIVPTPPPFNGVVSRVAGMFDIDLPDTECRKPGIAGNYQVIFTFENDLTSVAGVSASTGTVASHSIGPQPNQYMVNLAGIPDAHYTTVTLNLVHDSQDFIGNVSSSMGVLIGDTTGDRVVNTSDVVQTKSRIGQSVTATNFRSDLNGTSSINGSDAAIVKSSIGSALP